MDKKDKTKPEETSKTSSVLDDILGNDLGFGMDDLGMDLGMDLDSILNTGIADLTKSSKGAFDDIISPSQEKLPAVTSESSPATPPPDATEEATPAETPVEAAPEDTSATTETATETATETTTETDAVLVATNAAVTDDALAEADDALAEADDALAAPAEEALATDVVAEAPEAPAIETVATPEATEVAETVAPAEVAPAAPEAPEEAPVAAEAPEETPAPTLVSAPEEKALPVLEPPPAPEVPEEASAKANTSAQAMLSISAPKAHERTMELEEADEVLEELRALHQRTQGPPPPPASRATPPPPPKKKGPPPPPPKTLLRGPNDGPSTLELDLGDAVVEVDPNGGEDALPRIKAKALESAPIAVPDDAPEAPLPPPPNDLKELLDVPNPNMPAPPASLDHEVSFPEAPLKPPPEDLKELLDVPNSQLGAPPSDLKPLGGETTPAEGTESTEAAEASANNAAEDKADEASLFPGVDPSEPPVAPQALPQATPATTDGGASFADAVSNSAAELAAIVEPPAPVAPPMGNQTQLLGPDFAESLQQELHNLDAPTTTEAKEETSQEAKEEALFPPVEPAAPASGTADFLDASEDAPAAPAPSPAPKKAANPLMQTAMYGAEMGEITQQLIEAREAKEAAEEAAKIIAVVEESPTVADLPALGDAKSPLKTQLYDADVSKAVAKVVDENKATLVEFDQKPELEELAKEGVKVQLDPANQQFQSDLPSDSLFDVNMDSEIEARVAAKQREQEAEQAIQNKDFSKAIRIYHELQQAYPQEAHFQERLKQLVSLDKQSQSNVGPAPAAAPPRRTGNSQSKAARPSMSSARKAQPQGLSTLNKVLAGLVFILAITLLTGLVWPGWLRSKPKPKAKPNVIAPLVPAGDLPTNKRK